MGEAEALVLGCGAGLSAAAGITYSGPRFETAFPDFIAKYHYKDMYSAGFCHYETPAEFWAYWSRHIFLNRYTPPSKPVYDRLFELIHGLDYFVITTNVDHCFQKTGFNKERLFYTQGDYGLWQCSVPCHQKTYDNEAVVRRMVNEQKNMLIPEDLIPYCPECGEPMSMNLRYDYTFVEDEGWHRAKARYVDFLSKYQDRRVLYLEIGVGGNTPGIIKYPFWKMTLNNPLATYACINPGEVVLPKEIAERSILINEDAGKAIEWLTENGEL